MKYAQLVLGPAGVGKSTYCKAIIEHCDTIKRVMHAFNLDPAAEDFYYPVSGNIKDLITVEDVMEELNLGPNGALIYAMEYFETHMDEWLSEALEGFCDDDYILFDCPGQSELCTNSEVFKTLIEYLKNDNWTVCAVYCLDSHFITDITKFVAGNFQSLATMMQLGIPHINVLTKMDLCQLEDDIQEILMYDSDTILEKLNEVTEPSFAKLNKSISELVDEFNMVSFIPLDITKEESVEAVLQQIDKSIQFGDELEVRAKDIMMNN